MNVIDSIVNNAKHKFVYSSYFIRKLVLKILSTSISQAT